MSNATEKLSHATETCRVLTNETAMTVEDRKLYNHSKVQISKFLSVEQRIVTQCYQIVNTRGGHRVYFHNRICVAVGNPMDLQKMME